MARLLSPQQATWYDQLKAVGYYLEAHLEREILQHVRSLFPDFHVFPFKASVTSQTTDATHRPDLAMVSRRFDEWGIIEVELSDHNISHVLDQTRCFLDADYNPPEIAEYLQDQMKKFCEKKASLARISKLVNNKRPSVVVIADEHDRDWEDELRRQGITLCVFEIFKSLQGTHMYRTQGNYPFIPKNKAHCRRAATPNTWEIVTGFKFKNLGKKNEVDIVYDGVITRWSVMVVDGKQYLRFIGKTNPLSPNNTFCLQADRAHKYYLVIN